MESESHSGVITTLICFHVAAVDYGMGVGSIIGWGGDNGGVYVSVCECASVINLSCVCVCLYGEHTKVPVCLCVSAHTCVCIGLKLNECFSTSPPSSPSISIWDLLTLLLTGKHHDPFGLGQTLQTNTEPSFPYHWEVGGP